MKGPQLRAALEGAGFLVLRDRYDKAGFFVKHLNGNPLGFYELHDDGAYRFGWVEHSTGRTDCLSWPEFTQLLTERTTL